MQKTGGENRLLSEEANVNELDSIARELLKEPDKAGAWLVCADWLEEHGDTSDWALAELLRMQVQYNQEDALRQYELNKQAWKIMEQHSLAVALRPLKLQAAVKVLELRQTLALFLLAERMKGEEGLPEGATCQGRLLQGRYSFPTIWYLRRRKGNSFEGDMEEDLSALRGTPTVGRFYFRGVSLKGQLSFVTYRVAEAGVQPGLYWLEQKHGGWLKGTWWVPGHSLSGSLLLRRRLPG
jgi:uncharacterized protein (TIGR02996 family)